MTQEKALEILKTGNNVFLTGEPGAGKSYLIEQFVNYLKNKGIKYAITASTGIAATQIEGTTIHSWSSIGIKESLKLSDYYSIKNNPWAMARIIRTEVLIIDEISMLKSKFIDNLDSLLKFVFNNQDPFGGLQIVFVGDFFQLPPVTKIDEEVFAFQSDAWKKANLSICYLTDQYRQSDGEFLELLRSIRKGEINESQKQLLAKTALNPKSETQLFTHNASVDHINKSELRKIDHPMHSFKMLTKGNPFIIKGLIKNCLSPELLELKVDAIVMFTKNNPDANYYNGTIGKVTGFNKDGLPIVLTKDGNTVHVTKKKWEFEDENGNISWIKQIPLKLAWAITVHKSQGMSLDTANIDLSQAFEYGQGYVAISRLRSLQGLHLIGINEKSFMVHPDVIEQEKIFALTGK